VTERQLKLAFLMGHFSALSIMTTEAMLGVPRIMLMPDAVAYSINKTNEEEGDPWNIGNVTPEEIAEVLRLLDLERFSGVDTR